MTTFHFSPGAAVSIATVGDEGSGIDTDLAFAPGVTAVVTADKAGNVPVTVYDLNGVVTQVTAGSSGWFSGFTTQDVPRVYLKFGDLEPQLHPSDELLNAYEEAVAAQAAAQAAQIAAQSAASNAEAARILAEASDIANLVDSEGIIRLDRLPEGIGGGANITWGLDPVEGTTQTRFWVDFGDGAGKHHLTRAGEALAILAQAGSASVAPNELVRRDSGGRHRVPTPVQDQDSAPKKYVDDAVAAAGGGGAVVAPDVRSSGKTLGPADAGRTIIATSSGAKDFVIPMDSTWNAPLGTEVAVVNDGSGACRLTNTTTDYTVHALHPVEQGNTFTIPHGGMVVAKKRAANVWQVVGQYA